MMSGTSEYLPRVIDRDLDELLPHLPAILLDGARGVGKTETARRRARTVRRLDDTREHLVVQADPDLAVRGDRPVLIDEWQRVPATWDSVKRAVDQDGAGGQFLLTGSAPSARSSVHSGAGRITTLRMRPLTLPERGVAEPTVSLAMLLDHTDPAEVQGRTDVSLEQYTDEILASGFPGLRGLGGRAGDLRMDAYLDRIVDHDLPESGQQVRRAATVKAWLTAYAAATSTTASWDSIRDAATPGLDDKPAKNTASTYSDVLTELRVLDDVPGWMPGSNHLRRLMRRSKHHLVDPALAARLVGVGKEQLLTGHGGRGFLPRDGTFLGALFESLATLSIRVFAQAADASVAHLREHSGRNEVDLIVERRDGRVLGIEVKLASSVGDQDVRHLKWLRSKIGDQWLDGLVVCTGPEAYRRPDGIIVVPLALLGP